MLPQFEEVEITIWHVLLSAHWIQGCAGPDGCDACHCQVVLLQYGTHSSRLRIAVTALSHRFTNTKVPWNQLHALVSNHLFALDKCFGVCSVGVGEALKRVVGEAVCMATLIDIEDL